MTIANEITKLRTNMTNSYTACQNKGAMMPTDQNFDNLATTIGTITTGGSAVISSLNITPTTSAQTITAPSGTDGYSPVNVAAVTAAIDQNISASNIKKDVVILGVTGSYEGSGGGGIGINREVKNGVYQIPASSFTFSLPSNATDVGNYGLYYAFYGCTGLTSLDLSSLTTASGSQSLSYAFYGCTGLTSVDLSSLTTVSGSQSLSYAFRGCTGLTSLDLSSLTTVSGSSGLFGAFYDCTGLTSVDLSSLTTASGSQSLFYAFYGCTGLTDIYFRALTTTSFGSRKNQFSGMLGGTGTTKTHTLHFPSNMQSTISGLNGYPNFGGTSGYVTLAFDLTATS